MIKTDMNFMSDGYFVSLFPNNEQAQRVWNEINEHFEGGKVPVHAWVSVKEQIQSAGYSVRKGSAKFKLSDDAILKALAA